MDGFGIGSGETDMMIQQSQLQMAKARRAELLAKSAKGATPEQIDETAREFEAVFLSQMLQHMFAEVDLNPMSEEKSPGDDIYKSMLIDEYAKILAQTGGIGVADFVKREMIALQEMQPLGNQ
jgi:peptidoglycan hydrolase FlgJ